MHIIAFFYNNSGPPECILQYTECMQNQFRTRWGRPPLQSKKFRANSVFSASSSCSKILKDKKYFNTVKNFRATFVFSGQAQVVQNSE